MIAHDEIRAIAADAGFPRVSLFLPTHRTGPGLRQDPIRLKTMLRDAARALVGQGLGVAEADDLLAEARAHTAGETDPFWQRRDRGLAVFVSPDGTRFLDAPLPFAERVHVGRRFVVKPLLPALMRDGRFYVLAASQEGAVLYRGNRYGLETVDDPRLGIGAETFFGRTQFPNDLGFHGARGSGGVQVHSLGESPADEQQAQVRRYAEALAVAVDASLANAAAPLVLAADDRLLGMLRKALKYGAVVEDAIREHPESLSPEALHARAYDRVRDRLDADRRVAIARFEARRGDGGAAMATRVEEIVPAAYEGRVEALVVAPDAAAEGVFSPSESRAIVSPQPNPNTLDLVDFAVLHTLANGGAVYARPVDRADDLPPVGALYRF